MLTKTSFVSILEFPCSSRRTARALRSRRGTPTGHPGPPPGSRKTSEAIVDDSLFSRVRTNRTTDQDTNLFNSVGYDTFLAAKSSKTSNYFQVFAPSVELWAQIFYRVHNGLNETDLNIPLLLAIAVMSHKVLQKCTANS